MPSRFNTRLAAHQRRGHLWVLAGLPARSARRLDRWLDALHELTPEQWAHVARESAKVDLEGEMHAAVVAVIEQHHLEVAAWFLRDAVETTLHYSRRAMARASEVSSDYTRIQRAAECAVLAVATENWLDRSIRDALTAPFELILPSASPQLPLRRRASDRPPRPAPSRR